MLNAHYNPRQIPTRICLRSVYAIKSKGILTPLVAQTRTNLILSDLSIALFVYVWWRMRKWWMCFVSLIFGHVSSHWKDSAPSWHKLGLVFMFDDEQGNDEQKNYKESIGRLRSLFRCDMMDGAGDSTVAGNRVNRLQICEYGCTTGRLHQTLLARTGSSFDIS